MKTIEVVWTDGYARTFQGYVTYDDTTLYVKGVDETRTSILLENVRFWVTD